jgi:hypothetical protein
VLRFVDRMNELRRTPEGRAMIPAIDPGDRLDTVVIRKDAVRDLRGRKLTLKVGDKMELVSVFKAMNEKKPGTMEIDLDHYVDSAVMGICARFLSYIDRFVPTDADVAAERARLEAESRTLYEMNRVLAAPLDGPLDSVHADEIIVDHDDIDGKIYKYIDERTIKNAKVELTQYRNVYTDQASRKAAEARDGRAKQKEFRDRSAELRANLVETIGPATEVFGLIENADDVDGSAGIARGTAGSVDRIIAGIHPDVASAKTAAVALIDRLLLTADIFELRQQYRSTRTTTGKSKNRIVLLEKAIRDSREVLIRTYPRMHMIRQHVDDALKNSIYYHTALDMQLTVADREVIQEFADAYTRVVSAINCKEKIRQIDAELDHRLDKISKITRTPAAGKVVAAANLAPLSADTFVRLD